VRAAISLNKNARQNGRLQINLRSGV